MFGPPGTGKTKTLIEAISQIIRNDNPTEFILVCATSNSACNEIAKRLLIDFGTDKMFRIFAKSVAFNMDDIPRSILDASNLKTGLHYYPSLNVIYQYKVSHWNLVVSKRLFLRSTLTECHFGWLGYCVHVNNGWSIVTGQN